MGEVVSLNLDQLEALRGLLGLVHYDSVALEWLDALPPGLHPDKCPDQRTMLILIASRTKLPAPQSIKFSVSKSLLCLVFDFMADAEKWHTYLGCSSWFGWKVDIT